MKRRGYDRSIINKILTNQEKTLMKIQSKKQNKKKTKKKNKKKQKKINKNKNKPRENIKGNTLARAYKRKLFFQKKERTYKV